jgi:hypothetical protein
VAAVSLQPCADFSLLGRLLSVARSFSLCLAGGMPAAAVWAGRGLPVPPSGSFPVFYFCIFLQCYCGGGLQCRGSPAAVALCFLRF